MEKVEFTTTFAALKGKGACESGYKKLATALGGITNYGKETPINLMQILESNGVDDCLWALRAVTHSKLDKVSRLMACDFAEAVLPIFEKEYPSDDRPRVSILTARRFANCEASVDEMAEAWAAAWAAARSAAGDAAWAAAWAAACAAAGDAAWAAQSEIIRKYLK